MSRNSKKSPGRLSSRGGSHHQDSNLENNLENKSLQKIPKDVNFKAQEQATPEMYNHEKQQHTKSPDIISSHQARDFWQSDNMEVFPVQNKSVYY